MDQEDNKPIEENQGKENPMENRAGEDTSSKKKGSGKGHKKELEELGDKLIDLSDKYLRLSAEFDNYRKRTLKEKMELVKSGGETVLTRVLPVVDNLERAMSSIRETTEIGAIKEGIELIYNNFTDFLKQNGVTPIDCFNQPFDSDIHEAITKIPVTDLEQKGKVVDVIEKGYYLHEKVLRYAKVVVGD
jgi:molecular chaperone GrpE